jgi:hypothetical protein
VSDDIHAEALERYERAAAFIRQGWVTRAEAEREYLGQDPRPIYFSPFRNSLVIREGFAMEKRAAEERDRREWVDGIRRRLGLVAGVHRCRVWRCGEADWGWFCLRKTCGEVGHFLPSQEAAAIAAQQHTRAFVPEPPEETPVTELDLLAYDALCGAVRAEQDAFAAALPGRMEQVAETINDYLGGLLPEGMRFEWTADDD